MTFRDNVVTFIRRSCRAVFLSLDNYSHGFRYELIYSFITIRWIVFCATGLWGFGERREPPEEVDPAVQARQRILDIIASHRQRALDNNQSYPRRSRTSVERSEGTFRPVPGQVRYLGQFFYPSWDDRRWKPTETDYEADDEDDDDY